MLPIGSTHHSPEACIRFPGLAHELGVSTQRTEALAVKIEVDSRPPAGATLETTVVRRYEILNLRHHDQASLLAGKLHAVLVRPYPKGRDYFDLIWYLSDPSWPEPNLGFLNNALRQTGWSRAPMTAASWRAAVLGRIRTLNWTQLVADVRPLLENPADLATVARENLVRLISPKRVQPTKARIESLTAPTGLRGRGSRRRQR